MQSCSLAALMATVICMRVSSCMQSPPMHQHISAFDCLKCTIIHWCSGPTEYNPSIHEHKKGLICSRDIRFKNTSSTPLGPGCYEVSPYSTCTELCTRIQHMYIDDYIAKQDRTIILLLCVCMCVMYMYLVVSALNYDCVIIMSMTGLDMK